MILLLALFLQKAAADERLLATVPDEYAANWNDPVFSSDGRGAAYRVTKDGKQFVMLGKDKGEEFDAVEPPLLLSADGKRVAYVARKGDARFVVHGGQKTEELEEVQFLQFAGDGRLAYAFVKKKLNFLAVGDSRSEIDGRVTELAFSPDGKRHAYAMATRGGAVAVLDDSAGDGFDAVQHLAFSPDGRQLAFAVRKGGLSFLMVGGQKVVRAEFEEMAYPAISARGELACNGRKGKNWCTFAFEKKGELLDYVAGSNAYTPLLRGAPIWSPDGTQIAYAARMGQWYVYWGDRKRLDGDQRSEAFEMAAHPAWSPDSKRVAFAAMSQGQWMIVVGARRSEPFARVGPPVFSHDGKKVAFGAVKSTGGKVELWWKVIPGE